VDASTRWLAVIGGIIALVVVASVLVLSSTRGEEEFADGSPEAAVQRYLRAVADRDATSALAMLTPEVEQRCGPFFRESITSRGDATFRATLEQTVPRGSVTEVRLKLTEMHGAPPFGGSEYSQSLIFELTKMGSDWRFTQPPWPLHCKFGPEPLPARTPAPPPAATPTPTPAPRSAR